MTENDLQRTVIELALRRHWLVMHQRPARTAKGWRTAVEGHAGFPDLVMVRPPRIVFIELKSARGQLTAYQRTWLDRLEATGKAEVYVWRPSDLGTIKETLL